MADLKLVGPLRLMGSLKLAGDGGKVLVNGAEALVERAKGMEAPIVPIPTPQSPANQGVDVSVVSSLGKTITAGNALVTVGMVLQGSFWPGMVPPSTTNLPPRQVTANGLPVNVKDDRYVIFPSGASGTFTDSGQGS